MVRAVVAVVDEEPPALPAQVVTAVYNNIFTAGTTAGPIWIQTDQTRLIQIPTTTRTIENHHFTGTGTGGTGIQIIGNNLTATTTDGTLITNTLYYPYTTTNIATVTSNWWGTPLMPITAAWNANELTSLEYEVLREYPALLEKVRVQLEAGRMMTSEYLVFIAEQEILTMPDRELFPFAVRAMKHLDQTLTSVETAMNTVLRKKLQEDLHHPAPTWCVGGGTVGYKSREFDWEGLSVEHERDVGENVVRAMLNRQYFPMALRWRRDLAILRKAKVWTTTPEGQAWVQAEAERLRQEQLEARERELRMEVQINQYRVNQARTEQAIENAVAKLEKRVSKARRERENFAKSSIKKAVKLADRLDKTSHVMMFCGNEEVTITSDECDVKFVVRSTGGPGWLFDRTQKGRSHTPYELMVLTKDDVFLTKLCVYFKDMPVLDQLLAISMLADAGDEERLLTTGNWFGHHQTWTEEKTEFIADHYPKLTQRCPLPYKPKVYVADGPRTDTTVIPANGTGIVFTNYVDESRIAWEPFDGRVRQWIKTWIETSIASREELMLH